MFERMLDKQIEPTIEDMANYCNQNGALFTLLNELLSNSFNTQQQVTFPYGNKYGWGIAHRLKQKLVCNIFAEKDAFTVMVRLSNKQFEAVYDQVHQYTQEYIDEKYQCGDGGWIHYRVTCKENFKDIQKILSVKCTN